MYLIACTWIPYSVKLKTLLRHCRESHNATSVMVLGPAGCGKTTVWKALMACHNRGKSKPSTVAETVNPKVMNGIVTASSLPSNPGLCRSMVKRMYSPLFQRTSSDYTAFSPFDDEAMMHGCSYTRQYAKVPSQLVPHRIIPTSLFHETRY